MINKLDRILWRKHRMLGIKRKNPHEVEIPTEIPKIFNA